MRSFLAGLALVATLLFAVPAKAPSLTLNTCPTAPSGQTLTNPPAVVSVNGVLRVTLTLNSSVTANATLICWSYRGLVNGKPATITTPPTLEVKQGERMIITLINNLTYPNGNIETPPPLRISDTATGDAMPGMNMGGATGTNGGAAPAPDPYALMCGQPQLAPTPTPDPVTGRIYGYHRSPWNEANLHFHGLNTSPKQPGDNVTSVLLCPHPLASQPNTYTYVVDIPRNEPPGTYWYHPHAHGESLYQVFLGLTGAIIVHSAQPSVPDQLPNELAIVRDEPALAGIAKYPLNRALIAAQPSFTQIRAQTANDLAYFHRNPTGDPFAPPNECPGPKIPYNTTSLTINGLGLPLNGNGTLGLPKATIGLGETQYWRLANTDAQTTLDLVLLVNGKAQPLMVTARDGVPLIVKNGKPTYQPVAMNHVLLPPAGRIEFYLTGATAGAQMVVRTLEINTGCVGDTDLARNLFYVVVGTKHVAQHIVVPPVTDPVPQRFSDLASQTPVKKRTLVLTEYLRSDEPEPDFYITDLSNPTAVEHPYRMTGPADTVVKEGTVEEWTIVNYTNEIHGFHIHQIHFMPLAGVTMEEGLGQLVDTVYVAHGGYNAKGVFVPHAVKVLMDFRGPDIIGMFVYHCHFLEHEDNGMMARIRVIP